MEDALPSRSGSASARLRTLRRLGRKREGCSGEARRRAKDPVQLRAELRLELLRLARAPADSRRRSSPGVGGGRGPGRAPYRSPEASPFRRRRRRARFRLLGRGRLLMPAGTCPDRSDDDRPCGLGSGHDGECEGERPWQRRKFSASRAIRLTRAEPVSNGQRGDRTARSRSGGK